MTVLTSTASVQFDQGGVAEVSATVWLNGGSRIYCHLYEDSAPILSITDQHVPDVGQRPRPGPGDRRGRELRPSAGRVRGPVRGRAGEAHSQRLHHAVGRPGLCRVGGVMKRLIEVGRP